MKMKLCKVTTQVSTVPGIRLTVDAPPNIPEPPTGPLPPPHPHTAPALLVSLPVVMANTKHSHFGTSVVFALEGNLVSPTSMSASRKEAPSLDLAAGFAHSERPPDKYLSNTGPNLYCLGWGFRSHRGDKKGV